MAGKNRRLDCTIALLSHGAKVDVVDNMGNTALHNAVMYNKSLNMVKALILLGANICAENNKKTLLLTLLRTCPEQKQQNFWTV